MPKPLVPTTPRPGGADEITDTTLRAFVGYNLRRAYLTVHDDFIVSLAELDLRTASFSSLSMIVDNPDIIQSRLAAALRLERSNLVIIIDELEQRELVTRNRVRTDRRAYALRATLKGRRLRDDAVRTIEAHEARVLRDLTTQERADLVSLLHRLEAPR